MSLTTREIRVEEGSLMTEDDPLPAEDVAPEDTAPDSQGAGAPSGGSRSKKGLKKKRRSLIEVIGVFTLSIVAIITAWCGFEASQWGGEMSISFAQASTARLQAATAEGRARDARTVDLIIWTEYVKALAENNTRLADYVEARFSPELEKAFKVWDAGGRVEAGPFTNAAYVPPGTEEAAALSAKADAKFAEGLINDVRGDNYQLLTVLFALVLFLTAMSSRPRAVWANWVLLGLAIFVTLIGVGILATFPIRF